MVLECSWDATVQSHHRQRHKWVYLWLRSHSPLIHRGVFMLPQLIMIIDYVVFFRGQNCH